MKCFPCDTRYVVPMSAIHFFYLQYITANGLKKHYRKVNDIPLRPYPDFVPRVKTIRERGYLECDERKYNYMSGLERKLYRSIFVLSILQYLFMVTTTIKLIHDIQSGKWNVYVNNVAQYTYFDNEKDAKAAAFDQACNAVIRGEKITVSYLVF